MKKETIIEHLNKNGNFFVIGQNSYPVAKSISMLTDEGSMIYENVDKLPRDAKRAFFEDLRTQKIIIGTIKKEIKLPESVKKYCMILRLKNGQ